MGDTGMRVLVVQNYPGTGLGQVGVALEEAEIAVDVRHAYDGEAIPDSDADYNGLIILGGEQNALADEDYPYFPQLLDLIRLFARNEKAVLGICLGSQLVARAFGGENLLARPLEFGWHDVALTDAGSEDPVLSAAGKKFPTFHWHCDTFSLPEQATLLAHSAKTPNQAFRIGRAVYGTQFHFEADRQLVDQWNDLFFDQIAEMDPQWQQNLPELKSGVGSRADESGAALARAWIAQI